MRYFFFIVFFFHSLVHCLGQHTEGDSTKTAFRLHSYLYIDSLYIEGNAKTKAFCILRELEFQVGDSIQMQELSETFKRNELRLMNMGLFTAAHIKIAEWTGKNRMAIRIQLVESWYIYPIPAFALADRNFNVWWRDQKRSLRRLNYGIDLYHFNLSGNSDLIKITSQLGYTQMFAVEYRRPWINKKQTIGLRTNISVSRSREVNLKNTDNVQIFYFDPDRFLRRHWLGSVELNYRPKLFDTHHFVAAWQKNKVRDTIATILNQDYYGAGRSTQQFASLSYIYERDIRDIRPYPLSGFYLKVGLSQHGILPNSDLYLTQLEPRFDVYFSLNKKWSVELKNQLRLSLPRKKPPFRNNKALGYWGSTLRGYEYYVIDGLDYGFVQSSLRFELLNSVFQLGKYMPISTFKSFPLKLYFSINNDIGYANDPHYNATSPLANELLYGYGVSLDIVAYYDKVAKIQYSRNALGEGGIFLFINTAF